MGVMTTPSAHMQRLADDVAASEYGVTLAEAVERLTEVLSDPRNDPDYIRRVIIDPARELLP